MNQNQPMLREHHGFKLRNIVNMYPHAAAFWHTATGFLQLSTRGDGSKVSYTNERFMVRSEGDSKPWAMTWIIQLTQYIISFPKVWIKGLDQIISKGPGPYNFWAAAIYIFPKSTEKKSPFNMVEMTSPYHLLLNTLPGTNSLTYPLQFVAYIFCLGGLFQPLSKQKSNQDGYTQVSLRRTYLEFSSSSTWKPASSPPRLPQFLPVHIDLNLLVRCLETVPNILSQMVVFHGDLPWYKPMKSMYGIFTYI